ncbi:MAG: hypothetical protein ACK4M9_06085 [Anaerobacillus sp.]|uniref:hypothetical protein n=1 Tax=Anaerobacillus sp. TaxID=1872506 RepID=UPI00391BCAEE
MTIRKLKVSVILFLFIVTYQTTVLANSSWQWLTSSPKVFLPYAILLTLSIEIIGIYVFAKMKEWSIKIKIAVVVVIANLASFLFPYILRAIDLHGFYSEGWVTSWNLAFETGPYYIVLAEYLLLTLAIEGPLVYLYLKKHVKNTGALLKLIILLNIVTTLIVAVLERILFYGRW